MTKNTASAYLISDEEKKVCITLTAGGIVGFSLAYTQTACP